MVGRTRFERVTIARLNVRGSQAHVSMRYLSRLRNRNYEAIAGLDHRPIGFSHKGCRLKTLRQRLLTREASVAAADLDTM